MIIKTVNIIFLTEMLGLFFNNDIIDIRVSRTT